MVGEHEDILIIYISFVIKFLSSLLIKHPAITIIDMIKYELMQSLFNLLENSEEIDSFIRLVITLSMKGMICRL